MANATGLINAGVGAAGNALTTSHEAALGYINPFLQTGSQYQSMYDDLMGLNGPEARARAQGIITSDPLWTGALGQQQNAALRALNARGLGGSGTAALAAQRVLNENYQPVLSRYQQGGQQGLQAAGMGADLSSRYGGNMANLLFGGAQQNAGIQISGSNALAQAQSIGPQNLLGLGGLLVGGFTPGLSGTSAFGNMAGAIGGAWNKLWGAGANVANPAYTYGNPGGYTPPTAPIGTGIWPS